MRPQYYMIVINISMSGHVGFTVQCIHIVLFTFMCTNSTLYVFHVSSVGID